MRWWRGERYIRIGGVWRVGEWVGVIIVYLVFFLFSFFFGLVGIKGSGLCMVGALD